MEKIDELFGDQSVGAVCLENLPATFYKNIVELKKRESGIRSLCMVAGHLFTSLLEKMDIETQFVDGLRVTTEEVLDVVEMVLSGSVNKQIVRQLVQAGGKAIGHSGVDGELLLSNQALKQMYLALSVK